MNAELRAMLIGGGSVLAAVAAVFGVWSMTVAPDPPAVAVARKEEKAARGEMLTQMREFIIHYRRAGIDYEKTQKDRVLAHLGVMAEIADDLEQGRLEHKAKTEQLHALRVQIENAINSVDNNWPTAGGQIKDLKNQCVDCHVTQKVPGDLFADVPVK